MSTKIKTGKKILEDFEKLSGKHKEVVSDFINYLRVKEEISATKEILKNESFIKSIMKGDEDFRSGKFKKWDEVKEDV